MILILFIFAIETIVYIYFTIKHLDRKITPMESLNKHNFHKFAFIICIIFFTFSCTKEKEVYLEFDDNDIVEIIRMNFLKDYNGVDIFQNDLFNWVNSKNLECNYSYDMSPIDIDSDSNYNIEYKKLCLNEPENDYDHVYTFKIISDEGNVKKDDIHFSYTSGNDNIFIYGNEENEVISYSVRIERGLSISKISKGYSNTEGKIEISNNVAPSNNNVFPYNIVYSVRLFVDHLEEGYNGYREHNGHIIYDDNDWYFKSDTGTMTKL